MYILFFLSSFIHFWKLFCNHRLGFQSSNPWGRRLGSCGILWIFCPLIARNFVCSNILCFWLWGNLCGRDLIFYHVFRLCDLPCIFRIRFFIFRRVFGWRNWGNCWTFLLSFFRKIVIFFWGYWVKIFGFFIMNSIFNYYIFGENVIKINFILFWVKFYRASLLETTNIDFIIFI